MNVTTTLSRLDEISGFRDDFRSWIKARAEPSLKISGDLASPNVATLAIVGGPDVLMAGAVLRGALEELSNAKVDRELVKMMGNAIEEAFKIIEQGTAVLDPDEELFQRAIERLAKED